MNAATLDRVQEAAEIFESWADDCIKNDVLRPTGVYLGTLHAFRGFARQVAQAIPKGDPIDRIADHAMQEIKAMADTARKDLGL